MALSDTEKTTLPPVDTVEPATSSENITEKEKDIGYTSRTLSSNSLDSDAHSTVVADNDDAAQGENGLSRFDTPRRDAVKVPRSKRRGLLGRFALVAEVENPYDYNNKLKWFITFIVAFAAAGAPLGSSIFFRTCKQHITVPDFPTDSDLF